MKNAFYRSLILAALAAICVGSNVQAQQRIEFVKGKSSVVVKGTTGDNSVMYVVRAKSGQKLVLDLSPATKAGIRVEFDGSYGESVLLREQKGGHYEIGLEESGDYTIFVGSNKRIPVRFSLTVGITKMSDI